MFILYPDCPSTGPASLGKVRAAVKWQIRDLNLDHYCNTLFEPSNSLESMPDPNVLSLQWEPVSIFPGLHLSSTHLLV